MLAERSLLGLPRVRRLRPFFALDTSALRIGITVVLGSIELAWLLLSGALALIAR